MRRFAWQIGGLAVALGAVLALGVLVFACGSSPTAHLTPTATSTPRPTPTPDPRVAEVEAAAQRYVQALADSMKSGSASELDQLSVPGSQAEGNAGVAAGIVHDKHVAFVTTKVDLTNVVADVLSSSAQVALDYSLTGYDADWPALTPRGTSHAITAHWILQFTFVGSSWLVDSAQ